MLIIALINLISISTMSNKLFCPDLILPLPNDRPLQVDRVNIQGYTNQQAVEVLKHTGQIVHLQLIRRGFRPEEIPPAVIPSVTILPSSTTIPTTTIVLRELELELEREEAEEPALGRKERKWEEFNEGQRRKTDSLSLIILSGTKSVI